MTHITPQVEVVSLSADIARTLRLSIPLIIAQVLHMSSGLVDSLIAGKIDSTALAAAGVATPLFFIILLGCIGLANGLSPIFARLIGEEREDDIGERYRQGLWYAGAACLVGFVSIRLLSVHIHRLQIDAELVEPARAYLQAVSWSLFFSPVIFASRNLFEATENSRSVMIVTLVAVIVNIIGSLALGLGYLGLPKLGIVGIGYATAISFAVMATASYILLRQPRYQRYAIFSQFSMPNLRLIKGMLALSIPIALSLLSEAGVFTAVSVQMGILGKVESAANLIVLQAGSLCFMLPLGLSFIIVARVSNAVGQGNLAGIRQRLQSGLIIAAGMGCLTVISLVLFRRPIIALFNNDAAVVALAMQLMLIVALFQLSDASQVIFAAALRGLHDTKVPMLISVFSYWGMGFCSGLLLAYVFDYGAFGLWIGLTLGLTAASILLALRLHHQLRQLRRDYTDGS